MQRYLDFATKTAPGADAEDLVIVLDESGSMLKPDLAPDRSTAARRASNALIDIKANAGSRDRIGCVGFSSGARVICPMTDVSHAEKIKRAISQDRADGCTDISAGLRRACELLDGDISSLPVAGLNLGLRLQQLFSPSPRRRSAASRSRRVILLSDGMHTEKVAPSVVADELKRQGITIDVIGIAGVDKSGLDEEELMKVASRDAAGQPRYAFISDSNQLIRKFEQLAQHIRPLRRRQS